MKKGFTLIELLAVIIILAILMIIAVPNILSTLSTARSNSFITQAQSIYKSDAVGDSGFSLTSTDSNYIGSYNAKYFDVYPSDSGGKKFNKRILGDATGEMGPFIISPYKSSWYEDYANFIGSSYPWFSRGGSVIYDLQSGLFGFAVSSGINSTSTGFRLVIAP